MICETCCIAVGQKSFAGEDPTLQEEHDAQRLEWPEVHISDMLVCFVNCMCKEHTCCRRHPGSRVEAYLWRAHAASGGQHLSSQCAGTPAV